MASVALDYDSRKGLKHVCKVVETIDRPIEVVWSTVSSFGAIKAWMPGIDTCHIDESKPQPPAHGAVRLVANLGIVMEETLEIYDVKEHFTSYRLKEGGPWAMKGCRGSFKLKSLGENKTEWTWSCDAAEIADETIAEVAPALIPFFLSGINEARRILERPAQSYL